MRNALPPVFAAAVLVAFFELGAAAGFMNPALFPPPHEVLRTMLEMPDDFRRAFLETATSTVAGYLASCLLGILAAFLLSLSDVLRRAVLPFAIFFQTVPIIAVAPLLVIYFGFGAGTVIASSLIVSIFPVLANTLIGLQSIDEGDLELFRLYRASRARTLFRLRLPRAYPAIYTGLKIAAGLSVIGTVAGEFVAGGGLGALIDSARTQQRIDVVFAALVLLSLLGLALIGALRALNILVNRRRPYGLNLRD